MDLSKVTNELIEGLELSLESRQGVKVLFSKSDYDLVYEVLNSVFIAGENNFIETESDIK